MYSYNNSAVVSRNNQQIAEMDELIGLFRRARDYLKVEFLAGL